VDNCRITPADASARKNEQLILREVAEVASVLIRSSGFTPDFLRAGYKAAKNGGTHKKIDRQYLESRLSKLPADARMLQLTVGNEIVEILALSTFKPVLDDAESK